jgi:hypothetical protein
MEKRYALYDKTDKCYLGFSTVSNDESNESVGVTFKLEDAIDGSIWLAKTYEQAEKIRTEHIPWYNADYESPACPHWIDSSELEVREILFP